jgi:uncharacterized membrane protein YeaQ/YmgE (transglycosylase-associated protein family)
MPLWLFWILLGLIAGSLAKFLMPGRDPAGCIFTIVLGIIGSFVGGLIGTRLGWGRINEGNLDLRSIALWCCSRSGGSSGDRGCSGRAISATLGVSPFVRSAAAANFQA